VTVTIGKLGVTMFDILPECRTTLDGLIHRALTEDAMADDDIPRWISAYELASTLYHEWLRPALDNSGNMREQLVRCLRVLEVMIGTDVVRDHEFDHDAVVLRVISALSQSKDIPKVAAIDQQLGKTLVERFEQHLLI
jgi:hypothetical protein